ncbi:unnamed protein product [Brassicogethes aeneus]|uniref:BESS domain-containing protein n=1 Tax=Brassicogethes aeneus TaxID=1431903 RepID=A0A9P0FCX0_BRAAE|nr:unnamed protein product [Brassicogethes aeneus]
MDCEIGPTDESTLDNSDLFKRYLSPSTSRTPGTKFNKILDRDQESSTSESRSSTPLQRNLNKSQPRVSKNSLIAQFEERSQKRMEILEAMHKKKDKTEPEDEVDLFMRSISMTVKKFPPALLNEAKLGILKLVSDIELAATHLPLKSSTNFNTSQSTAPTERSNVHFYDTSQYEQSHTTAVSSFFKDYNPENQNPAFSNASGHMDL